MLKRFHDAEMLEMSIVENIQRENLNPIEEAEAYHRLIEEFGLTQEQAAGQGREKPFGGGQFSAPAPIAGTHQGGHQRRQTEHGACARAAGCRYTGAAKRRLARDHRKGLSVRQTEELVKRCAKPPRRWNAKRQTPKIAIWPVADQLSRRFGTRVEIRAQRQKGQAFD
jgi:ParB family transcriptional regulator, chromosome partitioning protein